MTITILGRPISKKNSRRNFGHTSLPSLAFGKFHDSAMAQLCYKGYPKFTTPVFINYEFYMKGRLDSDVDNMEAGINDILQDAGILENDKLIVEHYAKKIAGCKDWSTEITIKKLDITNSTPEIIDSGITKVTNERKK